MQNFEPLANRNALGAFGNAGYNYLRGPGSFDLDANLSRVFHVRERAELRLASSSLTC
jgi:hypothetical protein